MLIGKTRDIFKNKPGLCWYNYFPGEKKFDHAGEKVYGMLSTLRCDCSPKGIPAQYMHDKGADPRNLVAKCLRFNETIITVQKKIHRPTKHMIRFMYCSNQILRVTSNVSTCYSIVICLIKKKKEGLVIRNTYR